MHHVEALGEHSRKEFLGGSLAIGACDAHYRNVKLATMLTRQLLESGETVVDENYPLVGLIGIFRLVDQGVGTALVECRLGKAVAIERLAFQGDEDTACRTVATVGSDLRMLQVKLV